jgi:hypothetical protein
LIADLLGSAWIGPGGRSRLTRGGRARVCSDEKVDAEGEVEPPPCTWWRGPDASVVPKVSGQKAFTVRSSVTGRVVALIVRSRRRSNDPGRSERLTK